MPTAQNAPQLTKDHLLGIDTLTAILGLSRSTVYRLVKVRKFPAPWKVAGRSLWKSGEIDAWMDTLRNDEVSL